MKTIEIIGEAVCPKCGSDRHPDGGEYKYCPHCGETRIIVTPSTAEKPL